MPVSSTAPATKDKNAWKLAVEDHNIAALQELLDRGFDIEWKMGSDSAHGKMTALQLACMEDWREGALWLMERGAKVGGVLRSKASALSFAVLGGDVELVEALLKRDSSNINIVSVFGASPLHEAVMGDVDMARALLRHGADPTIKTGRGEDALALARRNGDEEMQDAIRSAWSTQKVLLEKATPTPASRNHPRRM